MMKRTRDKNGDETERGKNEFPLLWGVRLFEGQRLWMDREAKRGGEGCEKVVEVTLRVVAIRESAVG